MLELIKKLDGAYLVRIISDHVWAWFGGNEILCYDMSGIETEKLTLPATIIDVFAVEDFLIDNRWPKDEDEPKEDVDPTKEINELAKDDDDVLLTEETMCFDKFMDDIVKKEDDNKHAVAKKLSNSKNLMKQYGDVYSEKAVNRFVIKGK